MGLRSSGMRSSGLRRSGLRSSGLQARPCKPERDRGPKPQHARNSGRSTPSAAHRKRVTLETTLIEHR
eukprot:13513550-Alexandrium_andersonii.AAC.1